MRYYAFPYIYRDIQLKSVVSNPCIQRPRINPCYGILRPGEPWLARITKQVMSATEYPTVAGLRAGIHDDTKLMKTIDRYLSVLLVVLLHEVTIQVML